MNNKLYIGNLSYSETEQSISDLFAECGSVDSVKIITDRDTGKSKGFGFAEMSSDSEAADVISKFDGKERDGRSMKVNPAKPREPRQNSERNYGNRY